MHATPTTLLEGQLAFLDAQIPGIRDGDIEAIHDGRVATRRVRELLPLCLREAGMGDEFRGTIRDVGRELGRVRDLDVEIALLEQMEQRVPRAGTLLALRRHAAGAKRQRRLRKLLKGLPDRLSPRATSLLIRSPRRVIHDRVWPAGWRTTLRDQLQSRREDAEAAVAHAGGVYFPNRLHVARIAVKKLRYSAELAVATGVAAIRPRVIRRFRRAQDALGEIHDWQLLLSALEAAPSPDADGCETVIMLLRSDIAARHRRFQERRDDLLSASHAVRTPQPALTGTRVVPVAAALGITALYAVARSRQ